MLTCYITIGLVNSLALLVLSFMILQNYALSGKVKQGILLANFTTILIIAAELGTSYFELQHLPFTRWFLICNVVGFSLSPFVAILLGNAFHSKRGSYYKLILITFALNCILAALSPRFGLIFHISSDDVYHRGPLFFFFILTYLFCALYFLYEIYLSIKKYPDSSRYTLMLLFLFVFAGTSIQIADPQIHVSWLCITFTIILCYAYLCELALKKDALTSLFNRFAYDHCLRIWGRKKHASILLFDVDKFKEINDHYGHSYGDSCLRIVARSINDVFSPIGACYRIGGDEFCVLSLSKNERLLQQTIKQFHRRLDALRKTDPLIPYVSVGYSFYDKTNGTMKQAVKQADAQMYRSKSSQQEQSPPKRENPTKQGHPEPTESATISVKA